MNTAITNITIMGTATIMTTEGASARDQLLLANWFSPSFPIGAFSFSHGLEWAVEAGDVVDRATASEWIGDLLRLGSGLNDAVLLVHAFRAEEAGDEAGLAAIAELAAAFHPSGERALESHAQGAAFLRAIEAAWPPPRPLRLGRVWQGDIAYPVAVGSVAAAHGLSLPVTLNGYLNAYVGNLVSAAIRLSALGQSDGQRVIADLLGAIGETARRALDLPLEDIGGACLRADLSSLRHETQYTRLFRS